MKANVKLFAILRERVGAGDLVVHIPENATVSDLLEELNARHPKLRVDVHSTMIAVNTEYVDHRYTLQDGDEVALIPPVSGGVWAGAEGAP